MKKTFLLILFCSFLFSAAAIAQPIIENPEKPLNVKSGRTVALKEVMRITEEGDAFYFRRPDLLNVGPDGSVFLTDKDQLLQFSPSGKFMRNYFKKGQGPGELNYISDFAVYDKGLIVHNAYPSKIVWFDFEGKPVKDFSARVSGASLQFRCFHAGVYYFIKSPYLMLNEIAGMEAVLEQPQVILSAEEGVEELKEFGSFSTQAYLKKARGGGAGIIPLTKIMSVPYQNKYLLISHTPEYTVKIVHLEKREILRTLKRKYERIKTPPEEKEGIQGGAMVDGKPVVAPAPEFTADVVNLFVHDKDIWVATSTKSKEKGVLIDVFNFEGTYIDSFYLPLPERPDTDIARPAPQVVMGDFLYALEKDADGIYMIKKYKIG